MRNTANLKSIKIVGSIAAALILAIGTVAVVSAQMAAVETNDQTSASQRNVSVTTQNEKQVGQIRPLTAAEAQKLADGIKELVNQSGEGLTSVRRADGTVAIDLEGRFENVMLAKKNADGTIEQSCVDNTEAAAEFLGIDPQRFGGEAKSGGAKKANVERRGDNQTPNKEELK